MASRIVEFFGYSPSDSSPNAKRAREKLWCPFVDNGCQKHHRDGAVSGACTIQQATGSPVICCPNRFYADHYSVLLDVARDAFGGSCELLPGSQAKQSEQKNGMTRVAVFGKGWGKELRLPNRGKSGGYFVDWVLARLDTGGNLAEFVALEVQSIDTTGSYRDERDAYAAGKKFIGNSTAGFNWENVNKRILPQIIYKGHVLRGERLCRKGMYFVCPSQVYDKIQERLGGNLREIHQQSGALTFLWYAVGPELSPGQTRKLVLGGRFTTTIDQIALAFTAPTNLPDSNVYEAAIKAGLS